MTLDDPAAIPKVDESGMYPLMEKTADRLAAPDDSEATCKIKFEMPKKIVFGGVGGSGIVGDILTDYCRDLIKLPAVTCRSVNVPAFVDSETLFVAISYSGETVETLHMFEQAKSAKAKLTVVCSGGKLLNRAKSFGLPYLKVTAGMPPRVALPELVGAVTHVLGESNILEDARGLLDLGSKAVREVTDSVKVTVPSKQNPAKQLASALKNRLPLLIGNEDHVSVLRRFKNELNENSKVPAIFQTLPEACHDDVEGLKALQELTTPQPVVLRGLHETEEEAKVVEKLVELFSQLKFPLPHFFSGVGEDKFGWLLSAVTFGDFVSFYLAVLNGVDPSKVALIPHFRAVRGQV